MRALPCIPAIALVASAVMARPAAAEELVTTMKAKLHVKPAESSRVVTHVPAGKSVVVIERKGRWLRVRAGRRRGWLTRTTVAAADQRDKIIARRRARRATRGKAKGWRAKHGYRVGTADPTGTATADRKERTASLDGKPRFSDPFAPDRPGAAVTDATREPARDDLTATSAPPVIVRPPNLTAHAAFGYRSLAMDYASDGTTGLGNYAVATGAMTSAVGARAGYSHGRLQLAVEADYRTSYSSPGIHYEPSAGGGMGDVGFMTHDASAVVIAGARIADAFGGTSARARGGYHYQAFLVDQLDNIARMPSESLAGPTVGAELSLPRAIGGTSLEVGLDVMVGGHRAQTEGRTDGTSSSAGALWVTTRLQHSLVAGFDLVLTHQYGHARTEWTGPSDRDTAETWANRTDSSQTVVIGVGRDLR